VHYGYYGVVAVDVLSYDNKKHFHRIGSIAVLYCLFCLQSAHR